MIYSEVGQRETLPVIPPSRPWMASARLFIRELPPLIEVVASWSR